jgi:hypothetical protein
MATKYIYKFTLPKKETVTEQVEETLADGRVALVPKTYEKEVQVEFGLKKPSKSQKDEIDLSYKSHFSEAIRRRVMPIAELQKQINDRDGVFSKKEIQRKQALIAEYETTRLKLEKITDAESQEFKDIIVSLQTNLDELDAINQKEAALYNQSAEGYAKNKIIFEVLAQNSFNLSENKEFFAGDDLAAKLETVQEIDETGTDFEHDALKVFYGVIGLYFNNDRLTQDDFDKALAPILKKADKKVE